MQNPTQTHFGYLSNDGNSQNNYNPSNNTTPLIFMQNGSHLWKIEVRAETGELQFFYFNGTTYTLISSFLPV